MPLAAALALALLACSGPAEEAGDGQTLVAVPPVDGVVEDPAGLLYRLREVGPAGQVPTGVIVQLRRPLYAADEVGAAAPEGTQLHIDPPVAGRLEIAGKDALRFVPTEPFSPGTRYTLRLMRLVGQGVDSEAPAGGIWERRFETPPFAFVGAGLVTRSADGAEIGLRLSFSAPVELALASPYLYFTHEDQPIQPVSLVEGERAGEIIATFRGAAAWTGDIGVEVRSGVPYRHDPGLKTPTGSALVSLKQGPPVEVKAVAVREGVNGFYLDVVCHDPAAGGERYWWDPQTYDGWWLSRRCQLDEEALSAIHVEPAVELSLAEGPAGFRLFGNFERGTYSFRLDPGAWTRDGGVLPGAFTAELTVPERSPRLRFAGQGRYLPRSAWTSLPLFHRNVDKAELVLRHIPAENMAFWLGEDSEAATERNSVVVARKELAFGDQIDVEGTTWLDVKGIVPSPQPGVYELSVVDAEGKASDSSRLLLTELQLVARRGAPSGPAAHTAPIQVWALSAQENRPLTGVDLSLIRPSGQVISRCTTQGDAGCELRPPEDPLDQTQPIAIIARSGLDMTYLRFSDLRLEPEVDVGGLPWQAAESPYRAALYTERGVYRPGEVAHLGMVLRGEDHQAPPQEMGGVVKLTDPQGREVRRKAVSFGPTGMASLDLPFADFAPTGRWRAALEVGGREAGQVTFNVEEFVPERLKVEASAGRPGGQGISEAVEVKVQARWLFGGQATGSRVEASCRLESRPFQPDGETGWIYGDGGSEPPAAIQLGRVEGMVDETGTATLLCPAADGASGFGSAQVAADVAVFEGESGRATRSTAASQVHPGPWYVGLRPGRKELKTGEKVRFDGQVVDWSGELLGQDGPAEVEVEIERLEEEYGWSWEEEGGAAMRRLMRPVREVKERIPVEGGRFQLNFTPTVAAAGWRIRARSGTAITTVELGGDAPRWWWGEEEQASTPRPEQPTPLALTAPEHVELGEAIRVDSVAPYAGRLLWTVETDRVLAHRWQTVEAGPVSFDWEPEDFAPNVYVTALLLKDPHAESAEAWLPARAAGWRSVRILPTAHSQQVKLHLPEEARPNSEIEVEVEVSPRGEASTATVALVDEGILQLTRFVSPDPLGTIFARRRLGVESFETIGWSMLLPPGGPGRRTGGDAGGGIGRVQMAKPVALWQGLVSVPESGKVKVKVPIPSYRGELRAMVVTASKARMGRAEAKLRVSEPLVVQATPPRVLSAGDVAQVPVFVSNGTGAAQEVRVTLETSGPGGKQTLRVLGEAQGVLPLAEGASGTVVFRVQAEAAATSAQLRVKAETRGFSSEESFELPLFSPLPDSRQTRRLPLRGGELTWATKGHGWVTGADQSTLWASTNPYVGAMAELAPLLRYPYGCIEQTSSSTRPLLYAGTLVESVDPALVAGSSVDDKVRVGIERILSMATPSGGFAYWPGDSEPTRWGTAYATHVLLEAREAGHAVPEEPLKAALAWLEGEVSGTATGVDPELAYAHYVLARGGQARAAAARRMLDNGGGSGEELTEARYLLMAAAWLGGDRRDEAELKKLDIRPLRRSRKNTWIFYSDLRWRSLQVAVYQDLFGVDAQSEPLARLVSEGVEAQVASGWTTQELGWALAALGRRVKDSAAALPALELKVNNLTVASRPGKAGPAWSAPGLTGAWKVELDVQGQVPEGASMVLVTQGPREQRGPRSAGGLVVERSWLSPQGSPIDPGAVSLGQAFFVRLDLTNASKERVQNLALVDRLPAGVEIESTRISAEQMPPWMAEASAWGLDHMNVRDDRIEAFGALGPGQKVSLFYAVRAVTAGSFSGPEATLEAMYDPDRRARTDAAYMAIRGPWLAELL